TNDVVVPMTNGIANAAQFVTSAVVWGLADGACNLASLGSDLLNSIEQIDLGVGELEDCGGQMVCDAYGTEQIGSVATDGTRALPGGRTADSRTRSPAGGPGCTPAHL